MIMAMAEDTSTNPDPFRIFADLLQVQGETAAHIFGQFLPGSDLPPPEEPNSHEANVEGGDFARELQQNWRKFLDQQELPDRLPPLLSDPPQWHQYLEALYHHMPLASPERQQELWQQNLALAEEVLGKYGIGPKAEEPCEGVPDLPLKDRRFADPRWRKEPVFALIHQTYLMVGRQLLASVDEAEGLEEAERDRLRFATRTMIDALCPANFPMINPIVIERTIEKNGENLIRGMERLASDIEKGQLTHTDHRAFRLGENIAVTPGKVVHETPLYQLIQYTPTTAEVLEVPLVIFPPWINRFYILDLDPKKSFVRWAVEQGISTFVVSWRSADEAMAGITWDDYVRAQIDAIEHIRQRLRVPTVHAIGYCVAGTTLAATLAILARRGQAEKVKSATFLTAQVDFERAGDLKLFVDDVQLEMIKRASEAGYLDGRYVAATFNLLRGSDLIWNYVVNNYLLGEDYPAFDLLFWNSDVTNLPARWHIAYLRDLYRDNLLVIADALSADGTPIDLGLVETPSYIQAGREDHIAPPESVFRMTRHLSGKKRFILVGSGHIAGVINPPAAGKYQYWSNDTPAADLASFLEGAQEHKGSWWPDWLAWLRAHDAALVPANGRRDPGALRSDKVIEDAPGRYVKMR